MSKPLWDKGEATDALMHRLTVGDDPIVDLAFVRYDCLGSAAHARMLNKIGLLTTGALSDILAGLSAIANDPAFVIPPELEDVHTAIERRLGVSGEKIHAGRSRNDQIILATRLFMREQAVNWLQSLFSLAHLLSGKYGEIGALPMPGYTHLQRAMPSSVGMWLHAFLEGTLECIRDGLYFLDVIDSNPLGSAAGFGSTLPLDREYVAHLLGFSRVQRSPIDVQNSRGRYELRMLQWGVAIGAIWEKFAWDVELFVTEEFGFFLLPTRLTTGSSIMPQKRNPDLVELLRGRVSRIRGAAAELEWVGAKLPSNYHRDLQLTKGALVQGCTDVNDIIAMAGLIIESLTPNEERLRATMTPDIYATYEAYRKVKDGVPFREAYRQVAAGGPERSDYSEDFASIAEATQGAVSECIKEQEQLEARVEVWRTRVEASTQCL